MRARFFSMMLLLIAGMQVHAQGTPAPTSPRGTVRTDTIWSQALGTTKQLVVYLPPSYHQPASASRRYPVAVYLHGANGTEGDWTVLGRLAETMDSLVAAGTHEMIVVMPDGDDGWWMTWNALNDVAACRRTPRRENADTFCVPWPKYDDYLVTDVLAHTDSAYRTIPQRAARGIAGLSMGGYGAITLATRYPQLFSVAAAHSAPLRLTLMADSSTLGTTGQVTWRDARTRDELRMALGVRWERFVPVFGSDSVAWMSRDPTRLLERAQRRGEPLPALLVDVGTEDGALAMNRSFRDALATRRIPLHYAEWPGRHDWAYWRAHLPESLRFIAGHIAP